MTIASPHRAHDGRPNSPAAGGLSDLCTRVTHYRDASWWLATAPAAVGRLDT